MKYWLISDTHNHHGRLKVPEGLDVVIHCADEFVRRNEWLNEPEARAFFDWYSALDVSVKIFVPGNHSMAVEKGLITPEQYSGVRFLIHQQTELEGLVVFGTPLYSEILRLGVHASARRFGCDMAVDSR